MRNINRMNDYFVRYLLGSLGNEDILENIVNCVLRDSGFQEVHNLEIINPHNLPENINLKESVLDVKAITKDNKKIIIEIQLSGNIDFVKRIFYYISKNIVSELNENESYDIISQVISINFVNFNMDFYDEGKAHRCFKLIDTENHQVSLDMMQMHIIEVPRFIKILNISDISSIIPAIVVRATIEANGFTKISIPKSKCPIALKSISPHAGDERDFKLKAN